MEKVKGDCNNNDESSCTESNSTGPSSIVYKKYGGNFFNEQAKELVEINSPMIQSLIFHEQSARGWGPKLYGLMDNGRIEEFVEGRTLQPEEAFTPEFVREIAVAYARFHSLKLPVKKQEFDLTRQLLNSVMEGKKQLAKFLESRDIKEQHPFMCFKRLQEFSFEEECNWIESMRRKVKQRTVLCTMDPNYLNRLVRKEKPGDPNASRVLIINFDISFYSDRGYDLGGHFVNRMFNWGCKESKMSGLPYPSESERKAFLTAYLEEFEKLASDLDKDSLDSLDNLTCEADFNAIVYVITLCIFGFNILSVLDQQPNMLTFIDPMMNLYAKLKKEFCEKYAHLASN